MSVISMKQLLEAGVILLHLVFFFRMFYSPSQPDETPVST